MSSISNLSSTNHVSDNAAQVEDESSKPSPILDLPNEILFRIFHFLPIKTAVCAKLVCKKFHEVASAAFALDLKNFPNLTIIGDEIWEKHPILKSLGFSTDDLAPLNPEEALMSVTKLSAIPLKGIKGVTIFSIPKGCSGYELGKIAPIHANEGGLFDAISAYEHGEDRIKELAAKKSYRVAMTNSPIKKSEFYHLAPGNTAYGMQTTGDNQLLLDEISCPMPKAFEIHTCNLLRFFETPESSQNSLSFNLSQVEEKSTCDQDKKYHLWAISTLPLPHYKKFSSGIFTGKYNLQQETEEKAGVVAMERLSP